VIQQCYQPSATCNARNRVAALLHPFSKQIVVMSLCGHLNLAAMAVAVLSALAAMAALPQGAAADAGFTLKVACTRMCLMP
jgi:hypothetical protein